MKNKRFSHSRLLMTTLLVAVLFSVTTSCKKSSSDTPGANEVYMENMAFTPSTLTVSPNTTVTWTNKDGVAHTVTSSAGLFDSGSIAKGGTYSYTFTTAGTYSYHCMIHPTMVGTVVVSSGQSTGNGY